jgi:hypothetical protein
VSISWTRVGPWLPFMKVQLLLLLLLLQMMMLTMTPCCQMGSADGYLFYSCQGARAVDLSQMPKWLQQV